jgi:phage protein D
VRLEQLEKLHGDFYVPTFVIKLGGEDLVRDLCLAVTSVTVDLKERAAGHFSFTVANAFDLTRREFVATSGEDPIDLLDLFEFGSSVAISLGYGDPSKLPLLLDGLVTELSTNFAAGGTPELTISGFDALYPLTIGKNTRNWEKKRDSEAVTDVATSRGISAAPERTTPVKRRIDQSQETDMVFIETLAKRNKATFYMRGDELYFGERHNKDSAVVELVWGLGLLGFSPEVNIARQITEVHVHSQPAKEGKAIVGKARRGDETGRDTNAESGAGRVGKALSEQPVLSVRAPVHTQAEADARAQAILDERAQEFVKGSGESIGLPEIVPDVNIELGGMGRGFNKTYWVSEATHTIDGNGYGTSFKVQETTV